MKTPLVSVVIPTYNAPALLLQTLDSVFAQTFTDYEVVIINDGSTDDTAARLQPLAEAGRIRLITQPNRGIGHARNRCIDEARGTYIALLDHDDLWQPGKLAAQVAYAQAHPECSIIIVPWAMSEHPQRCVFARESLEPSGLITHPLRRMSHGELFLCSSAMFFEKSRAAGLRYGTRPCCIEDQQFHFGLLGRGEFGCAGEDILMVYRLHTTNYSSQADYWYNGVRWLREMDRAAGFRELRTRNGGEFSPDLDAFLAHFGRTATAKELMAGQRRKALRLYLEELPAQLRQRRAKFLLAVPLLLLAPKSLSARVFAGAS